MFKKTRVDFGKKKRSRLKNGAPIGALKGVEALPTKRYPIKEDPAEK